MAQRKHYIENCHAVGGDPLRAQKMYETNENERQQHTVLAITIESNLKQLESIGSQCGTAHTLYRKVDTL